MMQMVLDFVSTLPPPLDVLLLEFPRASILAVLVTTFMLVWLCRYSSPPSSRQRTQHASRLSNKYAMPSNQPLPKPADKLAKVTSSTVRQDFNDTRAVQHYDDAARKLGLWESEKIAIQRAFGPLMQAESIDRTWLLEAGCGAGRVAVGLCTPQSLTAPTLNSSNASSWIPFRHVVAFDFAEQQVQSAHAFISEKKLEQCIQVKHVDATDASAVQSCVQNKQLFDGALFMFNGLMQIPGRAQRQKALANLAAAVRRRGVLLFTTHDRKYMCQRSDKLRLLFEQQSKTYTPASQLKADRQLRVPEIGDHYFEEPSVGRTFMHLPTRGEVLALLAATGWKHEWDCMRDELVTEESTSVTDFSDECRFWCATRR